MISPLASHTLPPISLSMALRTSPSSLMQPSHSIKAIYIYIFTQSILHLRKLLFKPCPLNKPFTFFTRTSNSAPGELKIIEIFNSLPNETFGKITSLQYLLTFPTALKGKKGPWTKHFDLFQLTLDPCAAVSSIHLPAPDLLLHGIMFDDSAENIADTSKDLAQPNNPHARQNTIQAKFLSHTATICYTIPNL